MVARRKADPDVAAANEASTSGAPENDAFKDLIVAVSKTALSMCLLLWRLAALAEQQTIPLLVSQKVGCSLHGSSVLSA